MTAHLVATLAIVLALSDAKPLTVVTNLDPSKYAGRWFEIARLPNRFQAKCASDVTAEYQVRSEGGFIVVNRCRNAEGEVTDASGVARSTNGAPASVLKVRFAPAVLSVLPFVWGDYQVIALDDGHTYSVVGTPDRKELWILARQPQLGAEEYNQLVEVARKQGFAVERLEKTSHGGR